MKLTSLKLTSCRIRADRPGRTHQIAIGPAARAARLAVISKSGFATGLLERAATEYVRLVDVAQIYA